MTHIDESVLLAHLDGEAASAEASRVRQHLEECRRCRLRHRAVERRSDLLAGGLEEIDVEAPRLPWDEFGLPNAAEGVRRVVPGRAAPFLKAAAVVLLLTGAAAAVPGSPVDDWIVSASERVAGWFTGSEEVTETRVPDLVDEVDRSSGVAIALVGGEVTISLREIPEGTVVDVRLASRERAMVEATGATYRTGPGRLEVIGVSGGRVRIQIPRIAAAAQVFLDGEPAVVLEDGALRLLSDGSAPDSSVSFPVPEG